MFARIFTLILALSSLIFVSPVSAQTVSTPAAIPATVSPTSPLYTDLLLNNMFHSFSCVAIGQSVIGQPCLTYLQGVPVLSKVNSSGGVLGSTTTLIGMLYQNPPVRTADYLTSVGQGLGIVKTANAQVVGSGQAVLSPILKLWQVSRNISYVLIIIIFLVIGLMVIFRNKLNPQTVITAQTALPGLVIGLIMITFSYFFAGLISDMAFVGTNIVGYYFSAVKGQTSPPQNLVEDLKDKNVLNIVSPFTGLVDKNTASNMLSSIWPSLSESAQQLLTMLGVFLTVQTTGSGTEWLKAIPLAGAPAQAIISIAAGAAALTNPTAMIGVALAFVATAILLFAMIKLLLRLINAYLTIIFLILSAPFQFLAASLPGRQSIATGWILNMLAHILVFPAVLAVLYFVAFIVGDKFVQEHQLKPPFRVSRIDQTRDGLIPTVTAQAIGGKEGEIRIVDTSTFPLFGGFDLGFMNLILAFGALMALPSIPDIVIKSIGRMGQAGQLLGQEISGNLGQGQNYSRQFQQGVGSLGGQVAQARNLSGTTEYTYDSATGVYTRNDILSKTGGVGRLRGWWQNRQTNCLPPNTLISTALGLKAVKEIRLNDIVWTITVDNKIIQASVKQLRKKRVSKGHKILKLILADGRELYVSPGHPDAFGKDLALFKKGECLDRSVIVKRELLSYKHQYTYDLLPEGETGAYFANGILLGSTLRTQTKKLSSRENKDLWINI